MIARLQQRWRASLRYQLRHDNPRRLSRSDYVAELELQARAIAAVLRDDDAPGEFEVMRARADAARRAHEEPPPLTREQETAMLQAVAIRQSAGR